MSTKKHGKLRIAYLIPNIGCYLMILYIGFFIFQNARELEEIGQLGMWLLMLILLTLVSLYGSYRIATWIKQGKV
ncbi:hypothetical protein [Brevibacillus invocatus]|uniref:Uncharacterized protein n=1 Tax=Brevibacillus invocatus TaxID=173959 RepID=A0A3M8C3R3_9BACL|nr:hypothetical protein [Brevibacillus invocatus]MCM3079281.1 hypothetical protein [Brevibacillus invocatus]MCM3429379.1 hypothetical protein [Brevibacillus invocatus]RNB70316.1 hypothetical protein EDM52_17280 [Brevibacillus invocatus]